MDPRSGVVRRHHVSEDVLQCVMRQAVVRAGIVKHASVHTLRHSFAVLHVRPRRLAFTNY